MRNWPLIGTLIALILVLVIGTWHNCTPHEIEGSDLPSESLRSAIKTDKQTKVNLKPIILIQEKEVIKYVTKYKTIRHDSLIPCEVKLVRCDSIIYVTDTLIKNLKHEIKIDSSIIKNQDEIILFKDAEIKAEKKRIRKQKRRTIIVTTLAVILAGLALTK